MTRYESILKVFPVLAGALVVAAFAHGADRERLLGGDSPSRFLTDVQPVLTKFGCNSGLCHGKATGQNGFRLSLLGFDPEYDYGAIVQEARGRRVFPGDPALSLVLLKATGTVTHGGGERFATGSAGYRVLHEWIRRGAPPHGGDEPVLEDLVVEPRDGVLAPGTEQQLLVTAHLSNGEQRDVTRTALYESNAPETADVSQTGLVTSTSRGGLLSIMVRFGGEVGVFHGTVPFHTRDSEAASVDARRAADDPGQASMSTIDRHLAASWRRLGVEPSAPASEAEFIRRVTLDVCGSLPTVGEIAAYTADTDPDRRARLIDRLLERPEYASYFALKWADILQNRGRGYGTSRQRGGTALFARWIRKSIAANKPYDRFVAEILTASGSQRTNPPTVWYRSVRTLADHVESVSQAFLGVRVQCAQCHHHPFERWSQADYYGLAAVFARIGRKGGFADGEVPTNEIIYSRNEGEVLHPKTGAVMHPRPLGGPDLALRRFEDPRPRFAEWLTAPENPFFARTMVNRLWAHFFGRGIIHPIDDARSTNPPSHPELLESLSREFIASGYDVKSVIRTICNSRAYGLSSRSGATNCEDSQSFARFYPRRLPAEALLDAISQVLDVPTPFDGAPGAFPAGTRAIELPDERVPSHFLDVFGRPGRSSACECERVVAPALTQALELVNSSAIHDKLSSKDGYAARVGGSARPHAENVRDIFLRMFARPPRVEELVTAAEFLELETDRQKAYRSLLWSLLATNEFLFNR